MSLSIFRRIWLLLILGYNPCVAFLLGEYLDSSILYDYSSHIKAHLESNLSSANKDGIIDLVSKINRDENEDRRHIYYSTEFLPGDVADWYPVAEMLFGNSTLLLSFRLIKNGTLNPRIFHDVFHKTVQEFSTGDTVSHNSLIDQVSAVILDFRNDFDKKCPDGPLMDYFQSHNISLTEYAKMQLQAILGTNETMIRLGVQLSEKQLSDCVYLISQAEQADFAVVTIDLKTISSSPLTAYGLNDMVAAVQTKHSNFFQNFRGHKQDDYNAKNMPVMFHFSLENDNSFYEEFKNDDETEEAIRSIVEDSHDPYFVFLETAIRTWTFERRYFERYDYSKVGKATMHQAILSYNGDYQNASKSSYNLLSRIKGRQHLPFYLYLHETDVSQCALQTIVSELKELPYSKDIIINEYTWNALVQFESKWAIDNSSCPNATNIRYPRQKVLHTHLILSEGIGSVWEYAESSLNLLLNEHPTVLGIQLHTIYFRANDIFQSACGHHCRNFLKEDKYDIPRRGLLQFADDIHQNQKYQLGCLVDYGPLTEVPSSAFINRTSALECSPILENVTTIIWKFQLDFETLENFTMNFNMKFTSKSPKYKLFQVFIARRQFMEQFPWINVTLQLHPDDQFFQTLGSIDTANINDSLLENRYPDTYKRSNCPKESVENYIETMGLMSIFHDVPMILRPLYDVKFPWFGVTSIPSADGRRNREFKYFCGRRRH